MSFMLALPKISLHGAGAIGDMVKLVAGKQWGQGADRHRRSAGEAGPAGQPVRRAG